MGDKGFNVEDLFIPHPVSINIRTFFRKKNQMSNETVFKDRKIASKCAHIKRIIGLGKTYKILTEPLSRIEASLASPVVKVVFALLLPQMHCSRYCIDYVNTMNTNKK